jgi:2-alkyl-3-oxoalkanoate reductase
MHALVTGGGGFLGRYIVEQLLARGDRVRSFGRGRYPELQAMGVDVVRGDILDLDDVMRACKGIDVVFHVAAVSGVGGRSEDYWEPNTVGTLHVLSACQEQGIATLVYTSSPSVTFCGSDQCGVDESAPLAIVWLSHYRGFYSLSKSLAEASVLAANGLGGLQSCALRPHLIWGPRDRHLIPRLLTRAKTGRLRRVGDGSNVIDVTYVENAAEAHLLAADKLAIPNSPVAGKAYFISQGQPVNCWQWIDEILSLAKLPPVRKAMSFNTAWHLGSLCEKLYALLRRKSDPPMTRFLAAQLAKSHWFDISAAKRDLGYQPRVSTEEGMRRLGEWLNQGRRAP